MSKDSSTTCEKVNSSSSLLDSCDDSTLNETDLDELKLAKNVLNEKNKDKVEMATDALDDLTQSQNTDSPCLQEDHTVLASDLSVKIKKSQRTKHPGKLQEKFSERSKTESQLEHQKIECDRELYRDRASLPIPQHSVLSTLVFVVGVCSGTLRLHYSQTRSCVHWRLCTCPGLAVSLPLLIKADLL
ncbi:ankyrin repeat domain-containing protein 26-like [Antechinus flavipes]|uniref:ankyrin repeat domain-containing protein 26-like n=1 Tax=Antechinus flavipes TaxID=38775 RepID=UPI002236393B|nr:ankyrin repeat domain-containing protein 26-like [Antechinus flavipes]